MEKFTNLGYAGVFLTVFLEQLGFPIPAFPLLIAMGAFIAAGHLVFGLSLFLCVIAALLADSIWYGVGRVKGASVLSLICRLSWKPDTCISTTKGLFGRYGVKTLIAAKFIPGLNTIAPPLAGVVGITWRRFLWFDSLGCLLWALVPLLLGMNFHDRIPSLSVWVGLIKNYLPWLLGLLLIGFFLWRLFSRWLYRRDLLKELRFGISVDELKSQLDENRNVFVLDIRHPMELAHRPMMIMGARHIGHHELHNRLGEIPLDQEIVVYCDCPHEEGAVAMVKLLRKHGAKSIRPLLGGLRAWEERGFATV